MQSFRRSYRSLGGVAKISSVASLRNLTAGFDLKFEFWYRRYDRPFVAISSDDGDFAAKLKIRGGF